MVIYMPEKMLLVRSCIDITCPIVALMMPALRLRWQNVKCLQGTVILMFSVN